MPTDYELLDSFLVRIDDSVEAGNNLLPESVHSPGSATLASWFRRLTELQSATAGLGEFFANATDAVVSAGGLDGAVLIFSDERWQRDCQPNDDQIAVPHRKELLQRAASEAATIYHSADRLQKASSLHGMPTAAISPVRDGNNLIVGYLFAWRQQSDEKNQRFGIRELEACFVRIVAQIVSATLIRHQQEKQVAEKSALLAQAFPQKVVDHLLVDPTIFDGRETVVTTLFADLRGFSAITNRLPARQTYCLINEVMDVWTDLVVECCGAVVDYFGDGLVAFWNAPLEVENHAGLAVRCAERIRESLPELSQMWETILECPLDAGIGISTGLAHVGNCGSRQRFKYGPHGTNVNLASRLEKLTKELSLPIVISEQTSRQIDADYLSRRICKARIRGFQSVVNIYEPVLPGSSMDINYLHDYEELLQKFETGNLSLPEPKLDLLGARHPNDSALRLLMRRIRETGDNDRRPIPEIRTFLRDVATGQT